MTGCIACYSTGDSTSGVPGTGIYVRISYNDVLIFFSICRTFEAPVARGCDNATVGQPCYTLSAGTHYLLQR